MRLVAAGLLSVFALSACDQAARETTPATAQDHAAMPGMSADVAASPYAAANARMHTAMSGADDPDPSRNFAKKMTAHHQGALEMARIGQEQGLDPEMKALADTIIADQTREIAQMEAYLGRTASSSN